MNRLDSTTSKKRTIQSCNIVSKKRTVWSHYTLETRWSHIVSLRESVLCNYITCSILQNRNSIKKNKNSIKKNWKYLIFSHTNRSDSLTNLNQIRKVRICILRIDVCSQKFARIRCIIFLIDFSIIFCLVHIIDIFNGFFTVKLHRYRIIDVASNIWKFWNSQWCYQDYDVICILVNIALLKQKILASWCIVYSILNIDFYIDVSFHEDAYSKRRNFSDVRSHVLQFDFTSYLKSLNHRISIRSFLQFSHRCMILSRWKNLFENFKQRIVEKNTSLKKSCRWKNFKTRIVEKICTKISNWIR